MKTGRIIQLAAGVVLVLIGVPLLATGAALAWLRVGVQDEDGWFRASPEPLMSEHVAVTSPDVDLGSRPDTHDWAPLDGELATCASRWRETACSSASAHPPTLPATCVA